LLEADDAEPRSDVIASMTTFRSGRQAKAERLDPFNIPKSNRRAGRNDDPVVKLNEVIAGLRSEYDGSFLSLFPLQHLGVMPSYLRERVVGRNRAIRIRLQSIIGRSNLFAQPTLDRGVSLLERTESGTHHLTGGRIGSRRHLLIDEGRVFHR
jgi:hypothetical protein